MAISGGCDLSVGLPVSVNANMVSLTGCLAALTFLIPDQLSLTGVLQWTPQTG